MSNSPVIVQWDNGGIADTDRLLRTGTLRSLIERINSRDIFESTQRLCRYLKNDDISLDITATAAYLLTLTPRLPEDGFICRLCVINKDIVAGQYGMFPIQLDDSTDWSMFLTAAVLKNSEVTDVDTVVAILWMLTKSGWPEGYYTWLGLNSEDLTQERFEAAVRKRCGI